MKTGGIFTGGDEELGSIHGRREEAQMQKGRRGKGTLRNNTKSSSAGPKV